MTNSESLLILLHEGHPDLEQRLTLNGSLNKLWEHI